MGETILKVNISELQTVRLKFENDVVHEIHADKLEEYANASHDGEQREQLLNLAKAIKFFSRSNAYPSIEFSLPVS